MKNIGEYFVFFIDEIQYIKDKDLESLLAAIHRINQLKLPLLFVGAGLPKILGLAGTRKSYSERLFNFVKVDSLKKEDSIDAIQ